MESKNMFFKHRFKINIYPLTLPFTFCALSAQNNGIARLDSFTESKYFSQPLARFFKRVNCSVWLWVKNPNTDAHWKAARASAYAFALNMVAPLYNWNLI
jgi:hypothetical protein